MYVKITDVWEPEDLDGQAVPGIAIAVEWSRTADPWVPIDSARMCWPDMAAFESWALIRARQLDRVMPPERMPPGLAGVVGTPYETGALAAELAAARSG